MTAATTNQVDYIRNLLVEKAARLTRKANGIANGIDLNTQDNRHEKARYDASLLLARVYSAIVIPAELDQARASRWIDAIKNDSMLDTALDNPKAAAALGIAELVEAERTAIERALKAV